MPVVRGPRLPAAAPLVPGQPATGRALGIPPDVPWEERPGHGPFGADSLHTRMVEWVMDSERWAAVARVAFQLLNGGGDRGTPGAPVADPPGAWHMAAVGDFGSGNDHERNVARQLRAGSPELVITVGDNVYAAGREQDYVRHFDAPDLYGTLSREVPFFPTVGNHDERYTADLRPYFKRFPQLDGNAYYAFSYRDADLIALDTDQDLTPGSAQYRWLEHELATAGRRARWRIIYMHYPLYGSAGEDFSDIRNALLPLLRRYHVQLVLAGHVHNYQHFAPVDGTQFLVIGNGGEQVAATPFTPLPAGCQLRSTRYGHVDIALGAARLVVRAVDEHGAVFDTTVVPVGSG